MTLYETLSIVFSSVALLISLYTLYISRKKGRLSVRFDIKMYQVKIDIINAGENSLVVTDIRVIVVINNMSYFGIVPKCPIVLPSKVERWGVIRLDDFGESIEKELENLFPDLHSLPAKISVYIETSQGDVYYRINDQTIDLFKSVEIGKQLKTK